SRFIAHFAQEFLVANQYCLPLYLLQPKLTVARKRSGDPSSIRENNRERQAYGPGVTKWSRHPRCRAVERRARRRRHYIVRAELFGRCQERMLNAGWLRECAQ